MGILDFFRRVERKDSAAAQIMVLNPGQPQWSGRDYTSFAREGYQMNVVAYQAINKICEAVALPPPLLFSGDEEITESPILELLKKPNPQQQFNDYVHALVGFYLLSGNGYQERVMLNGTPRELYPLRSDRMKIIPDASGVPSGYIYEVGGRKVQWDVDGEDSDILHLKTFNPVNDWYGLSPIEAAAFAIDQHNEAMGWMKALLQNSARPSGALTASADRDLSDDQFNRLKSELEDAYQGARNAGRPMLLEGGLDWKQMGLSPTDMGILEQKNASARDICLAFGVPPMLMGIPGDNTYSNYQEARLAFWEDTVIPLLGVIYGGWNEWLLPAFGEQYELRPDLDKIPAIVDKRMQLWEMADASHDLTINERRAMKGYERIEGGDVVLAPANMLPIGEDGKIDLQDVDAMAKAAGYGNVLPIDRKAT